jgi:hypothetical protein
MDAAAQAAAPAQGGADAQQGQGSRGCDGVSVAENLVRYLITRKGVENTNSCRKRATAPRIISPWILKPVKLLTPTEDNCNGLVMIRPAVPNPMSVCGVVRIKEAWVETGIPVIGGKVLDVAFVM